ncbi:toxin-antitoxin system toxin component (plasmid) [Cyanobacterium sp. HL-69]|uniref:HepT-like ribonuclease domain-containing protein n=1 Tax=Cyanobacterium sp. HL-69 TaxID=2054282 RepID=UPI000CA3B785|nr:toxin-antitoxin system toxin component [Cyanobacterium sp. HL-69]
MSRNLKLYLNDILSSIKKIQLYTENITESQLLEDEKTLDAVTHNLMIIGEATKNIPSEIRQEYKYIQWKQIIGLRNIIAHTYFSLDYEIIWDIVSNKKLDEFKQVILVILKKQI